MFSLRDSVLAAERRGWWVRSVGAPRPSAPATIPWKHLFGAKFFAGRACGFTYLQLSATDASVRTTMKGAAKCDEHCKLQNSANQQNFERILRFRDMPESMPTSESHWFHVLGLLSEHVFVHQHVSLLLMHRVYWCTSSKEHIEHSCASAPCLDLHHRDDRRNHFCTRHEVRSANPLNLSI